MDDAEARAILRQHDEDPPAKGRLSPEWRAKATHFADQDSGGDGYADGTGPGDFTEAAEPPAPGLPAERKPRKVINRAPSLASRFRKPSTGKPKAKKKHPRIPVTTFIETVWAGLGGIVMRVDAPLGRVLILEADAAGDILEDIVRDTAADRALQPVVRHYEQGRKAAALFGPPLVVAAIEMAQRLPQEQMEARMTLLEPMLVSSLMLWDEVSAEKAVQRLERRESERPRLEQAQDLARRIFATAEPVAEKEPAAA